MRIGINSSGFHKFLSGRYQELRETNLNKIAAGLGSSPADLRGAIDTRPTQVDLDEAEFLAVFRQVPSNYKPAAKLMLRGLLPPVRDHAEQPIRQRETGITAVSLKHGGELRTHQYARVIRESQAA